MNTDMKDLQPGIYSAEQVPMSAYLSDPCPVPSLSSGAAHRIITTTPKHVWWTHPRLGGHQREASSKSDIGSVAHELVLGGGSNIVIVDADDWRTKAAQTARDEARAQGKYPVLERKYQEALEMAGECANFLDQSEFAGVLGSGAGEATAIAQLGETWLRARPDWLNHERKVCLHYKTTDGSAAPEPFIRWVMKSMGYHVALAFYRLVLESIHDEFKGWQHIMLVQEQSAPFCASIISLGDADWAIADVKVERAIEIWRRCMESQQWPGFGGSIHYSEPTPWELAKAEAMA